MALKKNVKRIDPRYFMDEKVEPPLDEQIGGSDPRAISPREERAEPGERHSPPPGLSMDERASDVRISMEQVKLTLAQLVEVSTDEKGMAQPELWKLRQAFHQAEIQVSRMLDTAIGASPSPSHSETPAWQPMAPTPPE